MALSDFKFHIRTVQNNHLWNNGNCFENIDNLPDMQARVPKNDYSKYYTNLYHGDYFGLEFQFLYKGQFFPPKLFSEHFVIKPKVLSINNFRDEIHNIESFWLPFTSNNRSEYTFVDNVLKLNEKEQIIFDKNLAKIDLEKADIVGDAGFEEEKRFHKHQIYFQRLTNFALNIFRSVMYVQYTIKCVKDFDNGSIKLNQEIDSNILRFCLNHKNNNLFNNWILNKNSKLNNKTYISNNISFYNTYIKFGGNRDNFIHYQTDESYNLKDNKFLEDEKIFYFGRGGDVSDDSIKIFFMSKNPDFYKSKLGDYSNKYLGLVKNHYNYNDLKSMNIEFSSEKANEIFSQEDKSRITYKFVDAIQNKNSLVFNEENNDRDKYKPFQIGYCLTPKKNFVVEWFFSDRNNVFSPDMYYITNEQWKKIIKTFGTEQQSPDNRNYVLVKNKNLLFMVFPETIGKESYWNNQKTDLKRQDIWRDEDMYTKIGIDNKWFWSFIITDWVRDYHNTIYFQYNFGNALKNMFGQYPMNTYWNHDNGHENEILSRLFSQEVLSINSIILNLRKIYQNQPEELFHILPLNILYPADEIIYNLKVWLKKENPEIKKVLYTENDELKSKIEIKIDNTKDNIIVLK